mmetsp:Transcript_21026/g.29471  ORF Transcript_21026/g.29471 Transcript_21026/m.29471 type:complete len:121 (-) Transcript_21026:2341-2703(-)
MFKKKVILDEKSYKNVLKSGFFKSSYLQKNFFFLLKDNSNTCMKKNSYPFDFCNFSIQLQALKGNEQTLIKLIKLLFLNKNLMNIYTYYYKYPLRITFHRNKNVSKFYHFIIHFISLYYW